MGIDGDPISPDVGTGLEWAREGLGVTGVSVTAAVLFGAVVVILMFAMRS